MLGYMKVTRFLKKPCIAIYRFVSLIITMQIEPKQTISKAVEGQEKTSGIVDGGTQVESPGGEAQQADLAKAMQEMHQAEASAKNPVDSTSAVPKKKMSTLTKVFIAVAALFAGIIGLKFLTGSKKST
jgi:hypothetical protein